MSAMSPRFGTQSFLVALALLLLPLGYCSQSDSSFAADTMDVAGPFSISAPLVTSNGFTLKWSGSGIKGKLKIFISPEPPSELNGPLPLPFLLKEIPGTANRHEIKGLAPNLDYFVRMEGEGISSPVIHVRTLGGPRAKLESPLREIYAMGPSTLGIVLANGDGKSWQNGNWSLYRNDGRQIAITKIHRHSLPVGAPKYEIGVCAPIDNNVLDVDHQLFFNLAEPLGRLEVFHLKGPQGIDVILPFSDHYMETPAIKVNQVGYNPRATKRWAYVYGYLGDGGVMDLSSFPGKAKVLIESKNSLKTMTETLAGLAVTTRSTNDDDAGGAVKEINLSSLPAASRVRYRVHLPGVGVSYPTAVSEEAAFKTFYVAARGLFHNRWGGDLRPDVTEWSRPSDHPYVFTGDQQDFTQVYPKDQPETGKRPLKGGYHDAGDFNQAGMHTIVPMFLLSAYESNLQKFKDKQLMLPESGNGIPDLLDEALWGVAAWEQLQDPDGSVRMGAESYQHPCGIYPAHEDPLPYWTYGSHPNMTARAAGLFAQSARLIKPFDATRSAALKDRALKAYANALKGDASAAYMLYASGELLALTGDLAYKTDFERFWKAMGPYGAFNKMGLSTQPNPNAYLYDMENRKEAFAMADHVLAYVNHTSADKAIRDSSIRWFSKFTADFINDTMEAHAFRNPRKVGTSMNWGRGATMGTYAEAAMSMFRIPGINDAEKQEALNALSISADYMLGCNPLGMVFYTGLGSRRVEEPLHLDSLVFMKKGKGPMPGIPVFGPVDGPPMQYWSKAGTDAFYPPMNEAPHALRYGDIRTFVVTNESTVWGDYAPNLKLFSILLGYNMMPPKSWAPGQADHRNPLP